MMTEQTAAQASTRAATFGERLAAAVQRFGPLCAGIDPHRTLVESWGLRYDVDGLAAFTEACVEAFAGSVAVVKPQSAFYEVFGSRGVAILEEAVSALRAGGSLVLLDAKRGDIGSTMAAYAQAYLSDDSVAPADALTASPYLGFESLRPALDLAAATGRGLFVLGLTSNPEGRTVQHATLRDVSVAEAMVLGATAENAEARERGVLGSVGLVVGATVGSAVQELGLDLAGCNGPLLAPGVGAQGGTSEDLRQVFGDALPHVLPASSREVLSAGPEPARLREQAVRTSEAFASLLG
jgi:orotidine-5'-phosphate decarboxylase